MPLDTTGIVVTLYPEPDIGQVRVEWSSTHPAGTVYQVYLDRRLYSWGPARYASIPWGSAPVLVQVGAVAEGEGPTDLSGDLPAVAGLATRPRLTWYGGRYLDAGPDGLYDDLDGYRIYRSATAGAGVSYDEPVAEVPGFEGPFPVDGAGIGPAGRGRAGRSACPMKWTGEPLAGGAWQFEVRAVDRAGNEGDAVAAVTINVSAAPNPPAPDADGLRLTHTFDAGTGVATLNWLASP